MSPWYSKPECLSHFKKNCIQVNFTAIAQNMCLKITLYFPSNGKLCACGFSLSIANDSAIKITDEVLTEELHFGLIRIFLHCL